jgi:hypothetical protein
LTLSKLHGDIDGCGGIHHVEISSKFQVNKMCFKHFLLRIYVILYACCLHSKNSPPIIFAQIFFCLEWLLLLKPLSPLQIFCSRLKEQ